MRRHILARSLAHLAESHRARRGHTAALKSDSVKSSKLSDLRKLNLINLAVRYFHKNLTPCQSTFRQSRIVPSVWNWSMAEICWRIAFRKQVIQKSFADLRHPEFSFTTSVNINSQRLTLGLFSSDIWGWCYLFILFRFVSSSILVPIFFKHAILTRKMLHILHKQFVMSTQICEGYIIFVGPHISGIIRLQDCTNFPWPRKFLDVFKSIHGSDFGFCSDRIRHHLTKECVNKYCQRHRGTESWVGIIVDLATIKVIWNCFWIIEDLGIIKVINFEKG